MTSSCKALSVSLCLAALAASGCVSVRPWQRETLSHPAMAEQTDLEADTFDAHVAGAREAALDPGSGGGGGCGCN